MAFTRRMEPKMSLNNYQDFQYAFPLHNTFKSKTPETTVKHNLLNYFKAKTRHK